MELRSYTHFKCNFDSDSRCLYLIIKMEIRERLTVQSDQQLSTTIA